MASMMVELDISKGLLAMVEIVWGDSIIKHILDYDFHIHFRCPYFCETGHLKEKWPFLFLGEDDISREIYVLVQEPFPCLIFAIISVDNMEGMYLLESPSVYEGINRR